MTHSGLCVLCMLHLHVIKMVLFMLIADKSWSHEKRSRSKSSPVMTPPAPLNISAGSIQQSPSQISPGAASTASHTSHTSHISASSQPVSPRVESNSPSTTIITEPDTSSSQTLATGELLFITSIYTGCPLTYGK